MGPTGDKTVREVAKLITDEDPALRIAAIRALGNIGPDAAAALPALREAASTDSGADVRRWAADAIRRILEGNKRRK
jgi:HEAT repeat protein